LQLLVAPFPAIQCGICEYAGRTATLRPAFNVPVLRTYQWTLAGFLLAWLVLTAVTGGLIRRGSPGPQWLGHATTQLYVLAMGYQTYMLGTVTSPALLVPLGSILVGLLFFPPRVVWLGLATCTACVLLPEVARLAGLIPYAPLLRGSLHENPDVTYFWSGFMWFVVGPASVLLVVVFRHLVNELRVREKALSEIASTDVLTGISNRRHFMDLLTREYGRAVRSGRPLSCMMVDLDYFKHINDEHGHAVGDIVLRATSQRLSLGLRATDMVARIGGEEFAALLPDTDIEGAVRVAERCRELLRGAPVVVEGRASVRVTASFGLAALDTSLMKASGELLAAADRALYSSKGGGRDCVSISDAGLDALDSEPVR
jgi:diguanylate cyclase (GGDEF)-like protein